MKNNIPPTHPTLLPIMNDLSQREPIFHRLEFGTTRADLEKMTDEQFWEVGASGQHYNREYVIEALLERYKNPQPDIWETSDFQCREIAPNNYLLTYILIQDNQRITRRTTLWRRCDTHWKIVYHQGTIIQDPKI